MLSIKNQCIYSLCLEEASKSELLYQHGCIATCGGKIMARGYNTNRSRYNKDRYGIKTCTCHAEISVLIKLHYHLLKKCKEHKINKIFKKTTLYISRVKNEDTSYNSAPCFECLTMIKYYNVKRIIFYHDNEYFIMNPHDYTTQHQSYGKIYVDKYDHGY
jgi:tRNA(Arg) A34 adenosine deaminase TadA